MHLLHAWINEERQPIFFPFIVYIHLLWLIYFRHIFLKRKASEAELEDVRDLQWNIEGNVFKISIFLFLLQPSLFVVSQTKDNLDVSLGNSVISYVHSILLDAYWAVLLYAFKRIFSTFEKKKQKLDDLHFTLECNAVHAATVYLHTSFGCHLKWVCVLHKPVAVSVAQLIIHPVYLSSFAYLQVFTMKLGAVKA